MSSSKADGSVPKIWRVGEEVWIRRSSPSPSSSPARTTPPSSPASVRHYRLQGVIAFTGKVAFAEGYDWVGIRLTGPSVGQGKNDGSVKGKRYFFAAGTATATQVGNKNGLFVRHSALQERHASETETSPTRTTVAHNRTPVQSSMLRTPPRPTPAAEPARGAAPPASSLMERGLTPAVPLRRRIQLTEEITGSTDSIDNVLDELLSDEPVTMPSTTSPRRPVTSTLVASPLRDDSDLDNLLTDASVEKLREQQKPKAKSTFVAASPVDLLTDQVVAKASERSKQTEASTCVAKSPGDDNLRDALLADEPVERWSERSKPMAASPRDDNVLDALLGNDGGPVAKSSEGSKQTAASTYVASPSSDAGDLLGQTQLPLDTPDKSALSAPSNQGAWEFEEAERGLFSPERQHSPRRPPTARTRRVVYPSHARHDTTDDDNFIWSSSQRRWVSFLAGLSLSAIWILVVLTLYVPLDNGLPPLDRNDTSTWTEASLDPALWEWPDVPPLYTWFPASLLGLVAIIAAILRLPLVQTPRSKLGVVRPLAVYTSRLAAVVEVLTGLLTVGYTGLWTFILHDQTATAARSTVWTVHAFAVERWMLWMLVAVLIVIIPACLSIMVSLLPGSVQEPTEEPVEPPAVLQDRSLVHQSFQSEVVPLLQEERDPEAPDEEMGDYHLLQDDEELAAGGGGTEPAATGRIRGCRRLLQMAASQVVYLYLGCAVLLVRLPFSLAIPHFVSTTLSAVARSDFDVAHEAILALVICGSIDALLDFFCIFFFGYANLRIVKGVRLDLFRRLLHMEVAFFDAHHSGSLTSRLSSDTAAMASDLTWFFRFSIESVVRITGIATYMMIRSPELAACALAIVPAVAVVNKVYGDWLARNATAVQDALAATQTVAQESLQHIRTVISLGAESQRYQSYREKVLKHYQLNVRQVFWQGIYYMAVSTFLINTIVQGSILWFGSYLIYHHRLAADVLLAFMLYQGQLQNETMNLFQSYSSLIKSSGAGDQVFALLDRRTPPPGLGDNAEATAEEEDRDSPSTSLKFDKIVFRYPSRPEHKVLDGLDWEVAAGQTVALVGSSGCGKSTVLNLLQRLYDPSAGRVLINGVDLRLRNLIDYRRQIGVVTQDCVLFDGSIHENVVFGCDDEEDEEVIIERVADAVRLAHLADFVHSLAAGYDTQVGEGGIHLSGGQKQRLAIARAIYRRPALLVLDEATSSLDSASERQVQEALDELLAQRRGTTTIVVAHRLQTVRQADAIAVLKDGKIAEQGTHASLLRMKGLYHEMVERANRSGVMDG